MKITKVIIEGDSQVILNAIRKESTPNWHLQSKLEYTVMILKLFEEIIVKYIYREDNKEANILANKGANEEDNLTKN